MLKVKNNLKIFLTLSIMLGAIFIFNMNTVNANTIDEVYLQNMLDLIPDEITVDLKEVEFEKAEELIKDKAKKIWEDEGINIDGIDMYFSIASYIDIKECSIYIRGDESGERKSIIIKYNNTDSFSSTDEAYVKNLKITSPKYYTVPFSFFEKNEGRKEQFKIMSNYYNNQINDKSITVIASAGAGGSDGMINLWTWESGTHISIFKDGVFYETRQMGCEVMIPVITVPVTVQADKNIDYAMNIIQEYYNKEYAEYDYDYTITKLIPGSITYKGEDLNIENAYNVVGNMRDTERDLGIVIIKKDLSEEPVQKVDNETKIKLDAPKGVIPENTIIDVKPIKTGETYNNIKTVLSDVNNFVVFDITLNSNGVTIQPNGKVKISIPIPNDFDTSNLVVYRIDDDGTKTEYKVTVVTIDGVKYAQFETDHFSNYALAEKTTDDNTTDNNTTDNNTTDNNNRELDNEPKTGKVNYIALASMIALISLGGIVALKLKK